MLNRTHSPFVSAPQVRSYEGSGFSGYDNWVQGKQHRERKDGRLTVALGEDDTCKCGGRNVCGKE